MLHPSEGSWARALDRSRRASAAAPAAVALAAALLVSACGASAAPSNGVARLDSPSANPSDASASPAASEDYYAKALAYSVCMRQHGVTKFPDPVTDGHGSYGFQIQAGPGTGIDPNSTTFQSAQQACQSLMPPPPKGQGGQQDTQQFQEALAFSQCMRDHGVADFPDPQRGPNGGVTMQIKGGQGSDLDPNNPTFKAAQQACQSLLPGSNFGTTTGGGASGPGLGGSPASPAASSQP